MNDNSSINAEPPRERHVFGWLLFPISLFPLVALLTYDWHAVPTLHTPPAPTTNWIGALGDTFAFNSYQLIGLAAWIVPVICVILGLCLVTERRLGGLRRLFWLLVLLTASACLLQVAQAHAPGISAALRRLNLANAGGVVGYLVMTRALSPLISDFGASVLMIILLLIAFLAGVGLKNIVEFFAAVYRWATVRGYAAPSAAADGKRSAGTACSRASAAPDARS